MLRPDNGSLGIPVNDHTRGQASHVLLLKLAVLEQGQHNDGTKPLAANNDTVPLIHSVIPVVNRSLQGP